MDKDNDKLKKILEKLRKLMDLKDSALQCGETGEANAAAAAVTRLLLEYDLTLQDIPSEQKVLDPIGVESVPYKLPYMQHPWYWSMMDVIAEYNHADILRTRETNMLGQRMTSYSVVGRRQNREVTLYLISFLGHQFINIGRRQYPEWKIKYIHSTGMTPPPLGVYMKSFLEGCVIGLADKLHKEKQQFNNEKVTALVKSEKMAIDAFLEGMNVKEARSRKQTLIDSVVYDGVKAGQEISIHKGVEDRRKPDKQLK